jgi:glycosyltransferase involved in cell wall biosynthesis
MKLLVLVQDYPNNKGSISLMFVHTRNLYYKANGIDVEVLNFSASESYAIDGITVFPKSLLKHSDLTSYDLMLLHAPNLRSHFTFLRKHNKIEVPMVFFFHGHEIMKISNQYPEPYAYRKSKGILNNIIQNLYDNLKIRIWRKYFLNSPNEIILVFVSEWMRKVFYSNFQIIPENFKRSTYVISNSIGKVWETNRYSVSTPKEFDFITIRSNLDDSKYSIDLINSWAKNSANERFLIVGKGDFFNFNLKSKNITILEKTLPHDDLIKLVNQAKIALMPTRLDAQGLMACELASFGIPLITSDIDVCQSIFDGFPNVKLVDNNSIVIPLNKIKEELIKDYEYKRDERYYAANTVGQEIELFASLVRGTKVPQE